MVAFCMIKRKTWLHYGSTFLSILEDFDFLISANVVRMSWNFQRTCSKLSSDRCLRDVIIEEFWANFGHFLPANFCKLCTSNLKWSEILILVGLQRVRNNHECQFLTLMPHLQRVDFYNILTISSQIYLLKVAS